MDTNNLNENTAHAEDNNLIENKMDCVNNIAPIDTWWDLIHSDNSRIETTKMLRQVYESNLPTLGELLFTSACQYRCQHCFYHADYSKFNDNLSLEQWKVIIKDIYDNLGIRTFVHCGRSIDKTGIETLKWMRQSFNDLKIGLIDNGISLIPYLDELDDIQPDWIDISFDGMEEEHDLQRGQSGSFKKALSTISYLNQKDSVPKISILICLTSLNKDSVINLIEFMNHKGFKNYFIFPVSTFDDYRPFKELRVSDMDFVEFIQKLYLSTHKFKDIWIEVNMFDVEYVKGIKTFYPELWNRFIPEYEHLTYKKLQDGNEIYINYYPLSLHGIREFSVNCNGDVFFPQVVRKGRLSDEDVVGNLLSYESSEVMKRLRGSKLEFHVDDLLKEKKVIGRET
jgi:MoaA/NifB/PqqE/SkfB family radical SAM enzyme